MLVLRDSDISPILHNLTLPQCHHLLHTLWQALAAYTSQHSSPTAPKLLHQPVRETIVTDAQHTTLFMPASDTHSTTGIKIVTLPGGGGAARGAINIFSPEGELRGVINAQQITAFRTALATMIPFCHYRLPPKANVVVFGAGKQAEWHVRLALLLAADSIATVTVVNRRLGTLKRFEETVLAELGETFPGVAFHAITNEQADFYGRLRQAVGDSDAIFCCTPSTQPLFSESYLRRDDKARFISLIGSYKPHMQEVDSATLLSGNNILVDSKEACLEEAGELIMANVQREQLVEVGELPSPGETNEKRLLEGNTVFKCVGMGIMDIVIGRELLDIAGERGVGIRIESF
ncbi:hypothetical protein AJ79_08555 [Helicocarpus griseus UAMH5409]|uniref:Uncharacterized protein n=1 Tax=Helicocarpus griseus UAMH5409 TaxID=1447875 RepID=A0A2B7WSB7_9EURO|nr:hypothetical protein AJ79_08555 [Helicocarpus griseus UAMH5409]